MEFILKADVKFEAEDLSDAFLKLAHHFLHLYGDDVENKEIQFKSGDLNISADLR